MAMGMAKDPLLAGGWSRGRGTGQGNSSALQLAVMDGRGTGHPWAAGNSGRWDSLMTAVCPGSFPEVRPEELPITLSPELVKDAPGDRVHHRADVEVGSATLPCANYHTHAHVCRHTHSPASEHRGSGQEGPRWKLPCSPWPAWSQNN